MSPEYLLETRNLCKDFGGFSALGGVGLKVRRGSVHALIGPNGAGKTTCFNLITKFLEPTTGQIFYRGREITRMAAADIALMGMVRSFQISAVFLNLTVMENILVALQRKLDKSFHFWRSDRLLQRLHPRALELLKAVGLEGYAAMRAVELPYGRKRALEIVTTLALEPEMLLLDEPMSGMAREDIGRISALIKQAAANRTVLMVEHNLKVVADLSDTITVLHNGEILAEGTYEQISANQDVVEAYMGTGHD